MKFIKYIFAVTPVLMLTGATDSNKQTLYWDKIEHWAGQGSNRAALVVQFDDGGKEEAYVWGFRWNDADYPDGGPSGEDMFRAIVSECQDLYLFTQFTGPMGSTVDGIGYFDPEGEHPSSVIRYDFENAKEDTRVSFDYFTPNSFMGQSKAPGNFTPIYCNRAIDASANTNIIEHPINAREFGYPAYDYDWWQPSKELDLTKMRWHAGWYDGYWSYWVGNTDLSELSYSGLGYSSRKIQNNNVDGWKYQYLDGPVTGWDPDGISGASSSWHQLNYAHFNNREINTGLNDTNSEIVSVNAIYDLNGKVLKVNSSLKRGIYIVRYSDGTSKKISVK